MVLKIKKIIEREREREREEQQQTTNYKGTKKLHHAQKKKKINKKNV